MTAQILNLLVLVHLAATMYMAGVIWFVQLVHYPLFDAVKADHFASYEQAHSYWTTWVVAPPMLLELITALLLLCFVQEEAPFALALVGVVLLSVVWGATWLLLMPCHKRLERAFDAKTHCKLLRYNWIRTTAWSLRGIVAVVLAAILTS